VEKGVNKIDLFRLADGTECEPKEKTVCPQPDIFIEYKGIAFGIGMDNKLYIRENGTWRKA
jgi:hypothetical protein